MYFIIMHFVFIYYRAHNIENPPGVIKPTQFVDDGESLLAFLLITKTKLI